MPTDNQPSLVGGVASSIASGVYEGVKGAVIGGVAGAVAGTTISQLPNALNSDVVKAITDSVQAVMPDSAQEVVGTAADKVVTNLNTLLDGMKQFDTPVLGAAQLGAVAGGAVGTVNGLLNNSSRADRELRGENAVQDAKLNQLAEGMNATVQGLMQTQQALAATQQQVGVLGKFTDKILSERAHSGAKVSPAKPDAGVQMGHFTNKEAARKDADCAPSLSA